MHHSKYWMRDLEFGTRTPQSYCDADARILVVWPGEDVSILLPSDRSVMYVAVVDLDWAA